MICTGFSVTYEIVTPDSAAMGDADERGFICDAVRLRDAVESLFETRTSQVDGITAIEASDSYERRARWLSVYNGSEFETGATESRSIHFPENITESSRARLINLIKGAG